MNRYQDPNTRTHSQDPIPTGNLRKMFVERQSYRPCIAPFCRRLRKSLVQITINDTPDHVHVGDYYLFQWLIGVRAEIYHIWAVEDCEDIEWDSMDQP